MKDLKKTLTSLEERIKEMIKNGELSSYEERMFDTAYKAVNIEECRHVTENTNSRTIQDYATLKANFFNLKKS